jgi:hypothetical protein
MKCITARGLTVDMSKYINDNPEQIALGNAKMNARGDIVGPGGKIVTKAEDIATQYHRANPKSTVVRQVALKDLATEVFQTPAEAVAALENEKVAKTKAKPEVAKPEVEKPAAPASKKRKLSEDD